MIIHTYMGILKILLVQVLVLWYHRNRTRDSKLDICVLSVLTYTCTTKMSAYHQKKFKTVFNFFEKLILFRLLLFINRYVRRKYPYERKCLCCLLYVPTNVCTLERWYQCRAHCFFYREWNRLNSIITGSTVPYGTIEGTCTGTSMVPY